MLRVRDLRRTGLGLLSSTRLYNIGSISTLTYVAALCPLPSPVSAAERRALQVLTASPYHSWPHQFLTSLRHFGFPLEFSSLVDLALAAALRTALRSSSTLPSASSIIGNIWTSDDAILDPGRRNWVNHWVGESVSAHLRDAVDRVAARIDIPNHLILDKPVNLQREIF